MTMQPAAPIEISVVIPAYNESGRLPATLEKIRAYFEARRERVEILVVDDGSKDNTPALIEAFAAQPTRPGLEFRLLRNPGNRGKGYSVRHGMLQARGELRLFTDADLSAPIAEMEKLESALIQGADAAIGSRSRSELIQAHQSRFRETAGRFFNLIVKTLLGLRFHDTQCGFKLFRAEAAQQIFPRQTIERWGFDPELLFLARIRGLRVVEVPVVWAHAEGAKINMITDSARMFLEVFQIRWNSLTGRYRNHHSQEPAAETAAGVSQ
jgi:glycosyltransferase involved in cell wall biosynthesis